MSDKPEPWLYGDDAPPEPGEARSTDDPGQLAEAERQQEREAARRREVLQAMLSTPAGREFLAFLLFELCGLTQSTVVTSADTSFGFFRAGQRDIALKLQTMLRDADKTGYVALLTEHVHKM